MHARNQGATNDQSRSQERRSSASALKIIRISEKEEQDSRRRIISGEDEIATSPDHARLYRFTCSNILLSSDDAMTKNEHSSSKGHRLRVEEYLGGMRIINSAQLLIRVI